MSIPWDEGREKTLFLVLWRWLILQVRLAFLVIMFLRRITMGAYPLRRCFSMHNGYDHAILELNKEMESIFGEPTTAPGFNEVNSIQDSHNHPVQNDKPGRELTHVDTTGRAQMVDISKKEDTKRVAIAGCRVILGEKAFSLVAANQLTKGDVLNVAKIAGITGAKQTGNIIPLCHNINLTHVKVDLRLNKDDFSVDIEGEAATTGKTGVEMEAMTAVTIAGLTVYDMCKAVSKDIHITDVHLEHKSGGKSGTWSRS